MTLNQQVDLDGNLHDLAPASEQAHLFTSDPQIRGQLNMPTDQCQCGVPPENGGHAPECDHYWRAP